MDGRNDIREKTGSRRGASMPLALLLFLVCAMVASIVLTAATATAGTASQLAESDRLYYSITSAANVFREKLVDSNGNGHAVTVAVKAPVTGPAADNPAQLSVMVDGSVAASGSHSVLERAALAALIGKESPTGDDLQSVWAAWGNPGSGLSFTPDSREYNLACAGKDSLSLKVEAAVDSSGNLGFTFSQSNEAGAAKLVLSCSGDYEPGVINVTEQDGEYEIRYVTVTWTPTSLEKA